MHGALKLLKLGRRGKALTFQRYVSLGDSMVVDDYPGEGKGAASLLFRNQDHLYPEFRGKDLYSLNPEIEFVNLAADGASTADVLHEQIPALGKGGRERALITLTGGGNDILSRQSGASEILFRYRAIVDRLRQVFPACVILAATTYDPTDGVGDLFGDEVLAEQIAVLREVNDGIRGFADPPAVRVVEVHKHFLGHGIHCKDPDNPYFHPEDPSLWYVLTIEPNSRGAHEIRSLFWKALHAERGAS